MKNIYFLPILILFLTISKFVSSFLPAKSKSFLAEESKNLGSYINPMKNIRMDTIEAAISYLPLRTEVNEGLMIESMKNAKTYFSLSETETAFFIFKWMRENLYIAQDYFKPRDFPEEGNKTEEGTYIGGVGANEGFTALFTTMCNSLGLEAFTITGYLKTNVGREAETISNYLWNVVKLDLLYYLVDITLDFEIQHYYYSGFAPYEYLGLLFCQDPEIFIKSHFPLDQKWQLVSPTISLETWNSGLTINPYCFIKTVSPDLVNITINESITINITHDSEIKLVLEYKLHYIDENIDEYSCIFKRWSTYSQIICYPNKRGDYHLTIQNNCFEYYIKSTRTSSNPISFPRYYINYLNTYTEIIEPKYDKLMRGTLMTFKFNNQELDNLFIYMKKINSEEIAHLIELEKNENGEFFAEDVYILSDVIVSTKTQYSNLLDLFWYTSIPDPNKNEDTSFPYSYFNTTVPKNTLYSPFLDTLSIGKKYFFKIKCESRGKIAVKEGENYTYLTKIDSMFSGFVEIKGVSNEAIIVSVSDNDRYNNKFYRYKIQR